MIAPLPPRLLAVATLVTMVACEPPKQTTDPDNAEPFAVEQPFPTEQALEEMLAEAPPSGLERPAPADVATWTMVGVVPDSIGDEPLAGGDDNQRMAVEVLTEAGLRPTGALMCYAQQWATFVGRHDGYPPPDIDAFMRARCGHATPEVRIVHNVLDGDTDPRLERPRDDDVVSAPFVDLEPGSRVGFWAGAMPDGRVVVTWAQAADGGTIIEPRAMSANGEGQVHLRGQLPWRPEWIRASATRGPRGSAECRPSEQRGKAEGAFAFACTVEPSDPMAMIEVIAAPPGRLLGHTFVRMLVSPSGELPRAYEAPNLELPVGPDDRSVEARLAGINHLRRGLGLEPLVLSAPQSEVLANLVPYVHADDRAVMGAIAGWRVEGVVRDADLGSRVDPVAWSVARDLGAQLMSPAVRRRILDPEMDVYAYGVREHEDARESLEVTYGLFDRTDFGREEVAFFDELDFQRSLVGQPPVIRVSAPADVAELTESATRIREHTATPKQELDRLGRHFSESTGRSFRTILWAPLRVEGWRPDFPDELFSNQHIAAAVKISYFRPAGAAWGQHVVLLVYTILDGPMR